VAGISTTAAQPKHNDYLLLQKIADAFGRLEELTPLSVMMRKSASDQVYKYLPLHLYKLVGEK
jgi:hypothetical protein